MMSNGDREGQIFIFQGNISDILPYHVCKKSQTKQYELFYPSPRIAKFGKKKDITN